MPIRDLEAKRAYQREWMRKRRKAWFADKQCAQCGSKARLELDHIERAGKVSSTIWSWSKRRQEAELVKCQVLCHACHVKKSIRDMGRVPAKGTHGTLSAYRYCKCAQCRAAKSRSNKEQRLKHSKRV